MKKLLSATLAVALVFGASAAVGQTVKVSIDPDLAAGPLEPVQVFEKISPQFEVVVSMDAAGNASAAAEFVVTELIVAAPGVFKLGLPVKINNTPLDLGDNDNGEYILAFGGCEAYVPSLELVRQQYGDFSGAIPPNADLVLSLRGLQPGDSQPSSFGGQMGFYDCQDNPFLLEMGGAEGGVTDSGVVFPDGGCIINPTFEVVPTADGSMGQLKARF